MIHLARDRPRHGFFKVGILEHDKGVATAKLHRGLLEILSGSPGNSPSCIDTPGKCHAFYP